jgi:large subunit ribosomal protein L23
MKDPHDIIKSVRLSERATLLSENFNQYTFIVDRSATKPQISHAIETAFGKKVVQVRTMNIGGKPKRRGSGPQGRTNHYKKAIIRLKAGEKLDFA